MTIIKLSNKKNISSFRKWLKTIDIYNLILLLILASVGMLIVTAASPSIADRHGLNNFHFIEQHLIFLSISIFSIFFFSTLSYKGIMRISLLGLFLFTTMLVLVLIINNVNNGSARWISILGYTIQPSEFIKPFFIITIAHFLAEKNKIFLLNFSGERLAFILLFLITSLLYFQPDYGMLIIIFIVWCSQYFISGLKLKWSILMVVFGFFLIFIGYFSLDHVQKRIDSFLSPETPILQVEKSLEAYKSGGILGKGPGEGIIKGSISDAHTDFIFPVIAEEYGLIACLTILALITTIIMRGLYKTRKINSLFVLLSASGLLMQFGLQSLVNISVSLQLAPTTGITLPFISYGGSSLVAMGIAMGMMLALTRRTYGGKANI